MNERSREYYRQDNAKEYAYITADEFTDKQVIEKEKDILKSLDFDISTPTPAGFVNMIDQIGPLNRQVKFLARYLCDIVQLSSDLTCKHAPSLVAFSAVTLAHLSLRVPMSRQSDLTSIFGSWYTCEQLKECVDKVHGLW